MPEIGLQKTITRTCHIEMPSENREKKEKMIAHLSRRRPLEDDSQRHYVVCLVTARGTSESIADGICPEGTIRTSWCHCPTIDRETRICVKEPNSVIWGTGERYSRAPGIEGYTCRRRCMFETAQEGACSPFRTAAGLYHADDWDEHYADECCRLNDSDHSIHAFSPPSV